MNSLKIPSTIGSYNYCFSWSANEITEYLTLKHKSSLKDHCKHSA